MKNPERVRGEWGQEAKKKSQEQGTVMEGQREKIQNGQMEDKKFGDKGGAREQR